MNCDRCPHMERIRSALAPCQTCEAGKLHGQISADANGCADSVYSHAIERPTRPSKYVTRLSHSTENSTRIALATVFAFDPIEVLLVRHVMAGGSYASFRVTLHDLLVRLSQYRLDQSNAGFRSLVKTWADSIVEKFPAIRNLFDATLDANKGKHDRRRA